MLNPMNLLAFDIGASSGRGFLGRFDGNKITMEELHRFDNGCIDVNGVYYWDILHIYSNLKLALAAAGRKGTLDSFGIDTWAIDYGLLDKRGQLLGNPISYWNSSAEDVQAVSRQLPADELFERTGITRLKFNTIYQLYKRKLQQDVVLENADTLLMIPDLLGYFLTGESGTEYTNATTTMLYNPHIKSWDDQIIARLGFNRGIFTPVQNAGTIRGKLRTSVSEETGINQAAFVAIGTHDTASAIAAVPGTGNFAFLSSGTWSLIGFETDMPLLDKNVFEWGYSNEGTVQGGYRPLKNIMGLWIIQECRREWQRTGERISWDMLVNEAKSSAPFRCIIDPDCNGFFQAGNMVQKVRNYCEQTGQYVPQTRGEIARCIYESLALKYRWAVERLEQIWGRTIEALNIVGGGSQNKLLNQFTANAILRPVVAGPIEAACIGNLLMQALGLGEIASISQIREIVVRSFTTETYLPEDHGAWEDAYGKLCRLLKQAIGT